MSSLTENDENYEDDPREPCKYGTQCYQKNPKHHSRFKHPKKRKLEQEKSVDKIESKMEDLEEPIGNSEKKRKISENRVPSPVDVKDYILKKFLMEMPDDFYSFWEFCKDQSESKPTEVLKAVNLLLVGPFDALSGAIQSVKKENSDYLRHWRYFYDPPEFQTIIAGDESVQFHMGYFRDDPNEAPAFVASNKASESCKLQILGPNLFSALNSHIQSLLINAKRNHSVKLNVDKAKLLQTQLQKWADDHNFSLETTTPEMKARTKRLLMKTFHGVGVIVPYDKKTEVGYRPLPETDANLKKILKKIVESSSETERDKNFDTLQEIITLIQFANDECDYGMGLELGMNLFLYGDALLHSTVLHLLPLAYELLNRPQFAEIIRAHLQDRQKSKPVNLLLME